MKFVRTIEWECPSLEARERIDALVVAEGYTRSRRDDDALHYLRGTTKSRYLAIDPRFRHAELVVAVRPGSGGCIVRLGLEIPMPGLLVTPIEQTYWEQELARLAKMMRGEEAGSRALMRTHRVLAARARTNNYNAVFGALFFAAAAAILSTVVPALAPFSLVCAIAGFFAGRYLSLAWMKAHGQLD